MTISKEQFSAAIRYLGNNKLTSEKDVLSDDKSQIWVTFNARAIDGRQMHVTYFNDATLGDAQQEWYMSIEAVRGSEPGSVSEFSTYFLLFNGYVNDIKPENLFTVAKAGYGEFASVEVNSNEDFGFSFNEQVESLLISMAEVQLKKEKIYNNFIDSIENFSI